MTTAATQPANAQPGGNASAAGPDLEKSLVDQVLATLAVKPEQGLSTAEVAQRATKYGLNAIIEKEKSLGEQAFGYFTGSMAYVIEAAALVPGDIVKIRLGVIVPADLRLIGGDSASIDQAALS